jgi:hypothetical protein
MFDIMICQDVAFLTKHRKVITPNGPFCFWRVVQEKMIENGQNRNLSHNLFLFLGISACITEYLSRSRIEEKLMVLHSQIAEAIICLRKGSA